MHTVFALLCFVVVIHWLIFPYPSGLLHWHCGNLTIAPVPAKQSWWIWINTSCEFIMNDCITTIKQSTTKPCAYFLGYTVMHHPCFNLNSGLFNPPLLLGHGLDIFCISHKFIWCDYLSMPQLKLLCVSKKVQKCWWIHKYNNQTAREYWVSIQ